jgi:hypothetical protein
MSWSDLLHEAVLRALTGARPWLLQLRLPAADATRDLPFAEDAGRGDPGLKPSGSRGMSV